MNRNLSKLIQQNISFEPKNVVENWADLAALLALIIAIVISFLDHGLYEWRFWLSLILAATFFIIGTAVKTKELLWLRNLHVALLASMPAALILLRINGWAAILMLFILSAMVMYHLPSNLGYIWICGFGVFLIAVYSTMWQNNGDVFVAIGTFAGFLFFGNSAKSQLEAVHANSESTRLLAELRDAHRQLQAQAAQSEELAALEERNRLAREVHDTLGHRLTVAAVQLEAIQKLISREPAKAEEMAGIVREQIVDGLDELRRTVSTLRAPVEEDLTLGNALKHLVSDFEQATELSIELSLVDELPELPNSHRHALYRAAQEGLTNIQKHANARHAWITVERQNGSVVLTVTDDGYGIDEAVNHNGFGLRGLRERAIQVGGSSQIKRRASGGTEAIFAVPIVDGQKSLYP